MATSGFIQYEYPLAWGQYDSPKLRLSWERVSYSVENNTSTVEWKMELYLPARQRLTTDGRVIFNGVHTGWGHTSKVFNAGWNLLQSTTLVIKHDKDGIKSFDYSFEETYDARNPKASGTDTLERISRQPEFVIAPYFTDYSNPGFVYKNIAGNDMDVLQACIADSNGKVIVPYRDISKTDTLYTFYLTIAERDDLRIAAGGAALDVRFQIKYEIGSISGTVYKNSVMTLSNYAPILSPELDELDAEVMALTGGNAYILGFSDVRAVVNPTVPAGSMATIISQNVRCGAYENSNGVGVFRDISTNVFEFSAMDDRGTMTVEKITAEIVPYIPVSCRQTVRLDLDGAIVFTVEGNYFNASFGAKQNTLKLETRNRAAGEEWSEWEEITILVTLTDTGYSYTDTLSGYDPSGTYEFQTRVSDELTSAESAIGTVTLKPIFDWGKYDFNFNVPLTIEGYALADYVVETGTYPMYPENINNGTWHWCKWKSGKAECYGCRNYGNMAVATDWGGWFRSGSFSQDLPPGLFVDTPEVIDINLRQGSSGGWVVRYEYEEPTADTTGSFIVVRPKSATISQAYISFNIIGRW